MRIVKKNVYYCDYCKKRGLRSLAEHEKHCTANPNRRCRMPSCGNGPEELAEIKNKYQAMLLIEEKRISDNRANGIYLDTLAFTWKDIAKDCEGCPACTFAVMRQLKLLTHHLGICDDYNREEEWKKYWKETNEENRGYIAYSEY